ncbi:MAG TPA: AbrB/MazE/SpoVT family DNA-binding domain-containing protein [Candidatus Hydrogenedentes bacterium]|nr:AbrB/MazE/SpoVT family DNA-binding domain-containing protein [Candidatus Hydrogenedentota bacterium]
MNSVKVSRKFQIVIPKEIRESMNIRPGEAMQVFELDGRIEVVPVRPLKSLRGRFKGINTYIDREGDAAISGVQHGK